MLFFMAISVGAISVSIFFIAGALLGRSQHFQFDASNWVIRYRFKTTINPFREECYDFSEIEAFEIKVNEWDSYPNTYDISMKIREKREMKFGDITSKQDAEHDLAKIKTKLFI